MIKVSALASALVAALVLAGSAQAKCQLGKMADLPVTMEGESPVVPATINGKPVRFIADSGAFFSVISPASASELKLPLGGAPFGFYMVGIGGSADVSVATVHRFGLSGSVIPNVEFLVGGSDVGAGMRVGVIGQNVWGLGDVEYDLAHGDISLFRAEGCGRTLLAYWIKPDAALSILTIEARDPARQPFTRATVAVNGKDMHALFDTGANASVLSIAAARRAGIRTDGPGVRFAGYSRGFGNHLSKTWIAPVESFQIGDETVKHTELRIGDVGGGEDDMLIGADFFLSHHVLVANSQRRMYFTYNGGPVFDLSRKQDAADPPGDDADGGPPAAIVPAGPQTQVAGASASSPAAADDPTDAAAFSRRGSAFAARGQFEPALADYAHAISLAPTEPRYLVQRAGVRLQARQPFMAMEDLDAALRLKPDDPEARMMRAGLRLHGHDHAGARIDLDAAAAAASPESDAHLQIANLYSSLEDYPAAVKQYGVWMASHQADSRMAEALNGRCWARGLANVELDGALTDCDRAVRMRRGDAAELDSRGLVHLRRGEYEQAVADYDAALKINPKYAWSLYGRGVAEGKSGAIGKGQSDLAAAAALAPRLSERAAKIGLAADVSAPPAPAPSR